MMAVSETTVVLIVIAIGVVVILFGTRWLPENGVLNERTRIRMHLATLLIIVVLVGWVQNQSKDDDKRARENRANNRELCVQNVRWQTQTLSDRESAVSLVEGELEVAQVELEDSQAALDGALEITGTDPADYSPAEVFFVSVFTRDLERAQVHVDELTIELEVRRASLDELEAIALTECPPGE
jgi:hypothetical protein